MLKTNKQTSTHVHVYVNRELNLRLQQLQMIILITHDLIDPIPLHSNLSCVFCVCQPLEKGWAVIGKSWTTLDITKRGMASATYGFEGLWNFKIVDHAELIANSCFPGMSSGVRFLC